MLYSTVHVLGILSSEWIRDTIDMLEIMTRKFQTVMTNNYTYINKTISQLFCSVSIHLCCRWRSNYQRGTVGIQNEPSIASTPLHICGYSKSGPGFVFFCVQWLRDSFINIGIIVGCLNDVV
jgi:hypothetical protein